MEQSNWSVWYETESEGRLSGTQVFHVRPALPNDVDGDDDDYWVKGEGTNAEYSQLASMLAGKLHVRLCVEFVREHLYALEELLSDLMASGTLVSMDVTNDLLPQLPNVAMEHCHLILTLPSAPYMMMLKATDTVRVAGDPYVNTWTFGARQYRMLPDDMQQLADMEAATDVPDFQAIGL